MPDLSRRQFLQRAGWTAAGSILGLSLGPPPARGASNFANRKPNVLMVLADDQGWGDLSLNGNLNLATPNIDALAREGACFDRFFVCPVCSPTRAELLTGRYHSRGGVRGTSAGQERLNLNERTLAESFKAAGYATAAFGKWHNGSQWPYHPNARGFDEYYGFTSGHWGEYFSPPLEHNGQFVRGSGFITDDLFDHAMEFMEQHKDRPFFCYVPLNTPHSPFCVPDQYWKRFKDDPIVQRGRDGDAEEIAVTRCVAAMNVCIDENFGRLLRKLDALGLTGDTIVIYFSDNGPNSWRWNGGMKGRKGSTDEGGVRSPLMIRWPGRIQARTTIPQIAGAIDLLPTLTSLAGIPRVGDLPLDGKDLSPLLYGTDADWPDRMIFSVQAGKQISVRTQQFRYDQAGALYDMAADPGQTIDVAAQHPELAFELKRAVAQFRKEAIPPREDDRAYPVGYPEFPMTPLPARDGVPHGGVRRSASAPNCSYFVNWTNARQDSMTWDIEVQTTGDYVVAIHYTCPPAEAGSLIELSFSGSAVQGVVAPGWDPPLIDDQDRVARKAESYQKEFRPLSLGTMRLEKGRGPLTLRALKVPGHQVMDVRLVTLTLS